jgi:exodeoxyribonuclease V alpha subunit
LTDLSRFSGILAATTKLTTDEHISTENAVLEVLREMSLQQDLILETVEDIPLYFQPSFFYTEQNLAISILKLLEQPQSVDLPRVRSWIERFTQSQGISLSPEQQQAVEMSATQRLMILTGGPGCGKTFCTRTIVALWKAMDKKIALAAPTGRAAQRLSEMAGIEAKTIRA